MLFSRKDVAEFINARFEPAWETVRPVPTVKIDFGNACALTRTLHGNIATYACDTDGQVLDILPGIYQPSVYLNQLQQLVLLAQYVGQDPKTPREDRLREYHRVQAEALGQNQPALRLTDISIRSKVRIEGGVKLALTSGTVPENRGTVERAGRDDGTSGSSPTHDVVHWKQLEQDTLANETVRRRQIHEILAAN